MTPEERELAALALRHYARQTLLDSRGRRAIGPAWAAYRAELRLTAARAAEMADRIELAEACPCPNLAGDCDGQHAETAALACLTCGSTDFELQLGGRKPGQIRCAGCGLSIAGAGQ